MKHLKIILCILLTVILACKTTKHSITHTTITGTWELVYLKDKNFDKGALKSTPQLTFDSSSVAGTTGCNSIRTNYRIKNDSIKIDERVVMTKMFCNEGIENEFLDAIKRTNRFVLEKSELQFFENSLLLMRFEKTR